MMKQQFITVLLVSAVFTLKAQIQTGVFRNPDNNTSYNQFIRNGIGAALYINQISSSQTILSLSSGTATANAGVVFTVLHDGTTGIGTTSPQSKLAVNGTVTAKEVNVTTTGWPDYVFKPGYRLPSLTEVSEQIIKQGHLPDMPSAGDIEKNGLSLGTMNKLQQQKIEELTLYLIGQDKKIEQLEKENQRLKKEQQQQLNDQQALTDRLAQRLSELEKTIKLQQPKK